MTVLNLADALRVGANAVDKCYLGTQEVWAASGGPTVETFTWSSDGYNGIIDHLGKLKGGGTFANPSGGGNPIYAAGTDPYGGQGLDRMFDHNTGTEYHSAQYGSAYVIMEFPFRKVKPRRLALMGRGDGFALPRYFKLQGSNDAVTWTDLMEAVNEGPNVNSWWSKAVSEPAESYGFLRIILTPNNDDYLIIREIELWGDLETYEIPAESETPLTRVWDGNTWDGLFDALGKRKGGGTFTNPATGTGALVSVSQSSLQGGGQEADKALDHNSGTIVHTQSAANSWWKADFGANASVKVSRFGIMGRPPGDTHLPRTFKLQGSNDDSTWVDLAASAGEGPPNGDWWSRAADDTNAYRYIRLVQTGLDSGSGNYLTMAEFEIWGVYIEAGA